MQQMLLILLAIIVLALYSYSRQVDALRQQEIALEREIEVSVMDVKQVWESYMQSLPFAEEMSNGTLSSSTGYSESDLASLAQPIGPDAGENPNDASTFDDFDDFHRHTTTNYLFPVRGVDMPFKVEIDSVWYSGTLNAGRSTTKSALIRVTYTTPRADLSPAEQETISLEQEVSLSING